MDRTATIIRYQWRAYWRRWRRGGKLTAGNQGIALLILGLIFIKYLQWLRFAMIDLSHGRSALFEGLLVGLFAAWFFPLTGNDQTGIATRRWRHLPLTLRELFFLRVTSLLMPPSSWVVAAASLMIVYPLAYSRQPVAGIVAASLFVVASGLIGLTFSHLLAIGFWRKVLASVALVFASAFGLYLSSGKDLISLTRFSRFLPSTLVVRVALGQRAAIAIAVLALFCVVAYIAALWSFQLSLNDAGSQSSRRHLSLTSFSFPSRLGGLWGKDFKYFRRLLDVYLGLLAAATGCIHLLTAELPSRGIFLIVVGLVFLFSSAVPFNSFGLDTRRGLDRYALLPLNGSSIILGKNLAYLTIVGAQLFPLIVLASWRLGPRASSLGLIEAVALASAYLTWGNWMSVNHPLKMQFFRFASSGAALADAFAGIAFGSLPGIVILYLVYKDGAWAFEESAAVALLFGALYWASVRLFGKRFERKQEAIAKALG